MELLRRQLRGRRPGGATPILHYNVYRIILMAVVLLTLLSVGYFTHAMSFGVDSEVQSKSLVMMHV